MDSKVYLEEMKKIQQNLLDLLDYEKNIEEKYQNLKNVFDDIKIYDDQYKIKSLMYLLLHICKNHHREEGFFNKIEQILKLFKDSLQKYFSNSELFHIFKSNKRILLFLIEEKIMTLDEFIAKRIIKGKYLDRKYPQYFQPEIQPFLKEKWFPKYDEKNSFNKWVTEIQDEIPSDFYEKRKNGENDDFICRLIQKDSIGEFITYVNKNDYPLKSTIDISKYETNSFLLKKKETTLIEYAAFFGSIQIFKYLYKNEVELTPSLWYYAIHGKDEEIFHILEENHVKLPENESYEQIFKESIKCHHIDAANYIQDNYLENENNTNTKYEMIDGLKYYNFIFIPNDDINETSFHYLCKYDYYILVFNLLNTKNIDVNKILI